MRGHRVTHGAYQNGQKQKNSKYRFFQRKIDFFREKSSNREGYDKALGKVTKIHADVYDKGSPDY